MQKLKEEHIETLLDCIQEMYPELLSKSFKYQKEINPDFIFYVVNEIFAIIYDDVVSVHKIYFRPFRDKIYNNIKICPTHLTKAITKYHNLYPDKYLYIDIPKVESLIEADINPDINIVLKNVSLFRSNIYVLPVILEDFNYTVPNISIRFCYTGSMQAYLQAMEYRDVYTNTINEEYSKTFNCIWCHPSWLGLTLFNILKNNKIIHIHPLMKEIINDRIITKGNLDYNEVYSVMKSLLGNPEKSSDTFKSITNNMWNLSRHNITEYNKNIIALEQRIWDLHRENKLKTLSGPVLKQRPRKVKTEEEKYEFVELTEEIISESEKNLKLLSLT